MHIKKMWQEREGTLEKPCTCTTQAIGYRENLFLHITYYVCSLLQLSGQAHQYPIIAIIIIIPVNNTAGLKLRSLNFKRPYPISVMVTRHLQTFRSHPATWLPATSCYVHLLSGVLSVTLMGHQAPAFHIT